MTFVFLFLYFVLSFIGFIEQPWNAEQSQHPLALQKIKFLEEAGNSKPDSDNNDKSNVEAFALPTFTKHLNDLACNEEDNARFECILEPRNDPDMKIEWLLNAKPLSCGSRIVANSDFGLISLDIQGVQPSDAGVLTCTASNIAGKASTSGTLKVNVQGNIVSETQHPAGKSGLDNIAKLDQPKMSTQMMLPEQSPEEQVTSAEKPVFTSSLPENVSITDKTLHLECQVEPKNDPKLSINWYHNGLPLTSASRIIPKHDFGFVTLDINDMSGRDNGIYTCKAVNDAGEAVVFTTVICQDQDEVDLGTQHPAGKSGLDNITKLDQPKMSTQMMLPEESPEEQVTSAEKPVFTSSLPENVSVTDKTLHLECHVEPKNDPKLSINWYHNGLPLTSASRIMPKHDFGFVTLDINDMSGRDEGIYTCKAVNDVGEAVVFTTVNCQDQGEIDLATQHPRGQEGLEAISNFEAKTQLNPDEQEHEIDSGEAPKFVQEFNNVNVTEGDHAYFEAKLEPSNSKADSSNTNSLNMVLEWSFNGKPLQESSRYKKIHSFGIVIFEIGNVSSTDAGSYSCTATNKFGSATSIMSLSFQEEKSSHCPKFVEQLEDKLNLKDGESVHMQCALEPINDPDLKVSWFFNDQPLPNSSRIKSVADFGYVMLDISGVDSRDTGKYTCRAWNKYGEDSVSCQLECKGQSGVQSKSLHPDSLAKIRTFELPGIFKKDGRTSSFITNN